MATVASNMNRDRTNRLLLIGAATLALIAGVLVAVVLADRGGSSSAAPPSGDQNVLVAKSDIKAGDKLTADMFRVATFAKPDTIADALSDPQAVVGQVATVDLLKGQQLSRTLIGQVAGSKLYDQLTFKLPDGMRGVALKVTEESDVAGLVIPGDRVDVVATVKEKHTDGQTYQRVHTVLQNVQVVARAQQDIEPIVTLDKDGKPVTDPSNNGVAGRPTDTTAKPDAHTVTLALRPDDVQTLLSWDALGDITLTLRRFGEGDTTPIQDLVVPILQ